MSEIEGNQATAEIAVNGNQELHPVGSPAASNLESLINRLKVTTSKQDVEDDEEEQSSRRHMKKKSITYTNYLQVDKLLEIQEPLSPIHDEHLFIVVHQVYELWFRQILYELDSVCELLNIEYVNENNMLVIIMRLNRIVRILQLMVDQVMVLETMSPLDFRAFRDYLGTSSGFQSVQFRLLENKLGIKKDNRIQYGGVDYKEVFEGDHRKEVEKSENKPTVLQLVDHWLSRTPGLEENGFNFWHRFAFAVTDFLNSLEQQAKKSTDQSSKEELLREREKLFDTFESILVREKHEELVNQGVRRLSYKAMQGALMISLYSDVPRFSQPYQFLQLLMDLESLLTKWRYNHVLLVQRMIGSKAGTGGSSGYQYLRSTVSDRYKVFNDLFNLSTFLIPREYIPPLTRSMAKRLSVGNTLM